jgi:hypothetical protein
VSFFSDKIVKLPTYVVDIHVLVVAGIPVLCVGSDNELVAGRDRNLQSHQPSVGTETLERAYVLAIPHKTCADLRPFLGIRLEHVQEEGGKVRTVSRAIATGRPASATEAGFTPWIDIASYIYIPATILRVLSITL